MAEAEADVSIHILLSLYGQQHEREALDEAASLAIGPFSDAHLLFEEFVKRFPIVRVTKPNRPLRAILQIAETKGGNPFELAFVLVNLFTSSGIDAETVYVYSDHEAESKDSFRRANVEHVMVYVPALGQYFDPTLRAAELLKESAGKWPEERPRAHYPYPSHGAGRGYYGKRVAPTK
jgi:hypothetical protein